MTERLLKTTLYPKNTFLLFDKIPVNHFLRSFISGCTVCLYTKNGTSDLYGLRYILNSVTSAWERAAKSSINSKYVLYPSLAEYWFLLTRSWSLLTLYIFKTYFFQICKFNTNKQVQLDSLLAPLSIFALQHAYVVHITFVPKQDFR